LAVKNAAMSALKVWWNAARSKPGAPEHGIGRGVCVKVAIRSKDVEMHVGWLSPES
jgi:hypothetical protein